MQLYGRKVIKRSIIIFATYDVILYAKNLYIHSLLWISRETGDPETTMPVVPIAAIDTVSTSSTNSSSSVRIGILTCVEMVE